MGRTAWKSITASLPLFSLRIPASCLEEVMCVMVDMLGGGGGYFNNGDGGQGAVWYSGT